MLGFKQAIDICLKQKYTAFSGRASRAEFWWFSLFTFIVLVVVEAIALAVQSSSILSMLFGLLLLVAAFGLIVPALAVTWRRLHDTGKSGWLILLYLIPLIGAVVMFIFYVLPSDSGSNAYGEAP
jgi:uncharacterized membrane protein YhaH (DUF805 family)